MDSLKVINSKTRKAYNLVAQKYHALFQYEMQEKEYDRKLLNNFSKKFNKDAILLDAGCGPSAHIGRYIFNKGIKVIGIDISDECVELAKKHNPQMEFKRQDISELQFENNMFDGIISYYSIIDTPKKYVYKLFNEFRRVLRQAGYLLVVVKAGKEEGYVHELLGIKSELYFTLFSKEEIANYFMQAKFTLEFIEQRNPYNFEISNERIFAIGKKI